MKKLGPPHIHFLSAAEGWLGLGNVAEAKAELARMSRRYLKHPQVLEVRWAIHAQEQDWKEALAAARALIECAPELAFGWVHQAYSLRRVADGGLQPAWDALFPAMEKFPKDPIIPYNLACYACQMQQPAKARILLTRAMALGDPAQIKRMALKDSDLEPIWAEIQTL